MAGAARDSLPRARRGARVVQQIGWQFQDRALRDIVASGSGIEFQRLELLGDALADAILLPWLYTWSTGTVAVLAGARQQLAGDRSLDHLAVLTGLHGVLPSDQRHSADHRADAVEAAIGACYVDGGWPAATEACEAVFGAWLSEPAGVAERAARIDVAAVPDRDRWRWRCVVWTSGAEEPYERSGSSEDPIEAELDALADGLVHLGRAHPSVWVELSDELRAEMNAGPESVHADRIRELRALLAAFDGVWFVPSERLDTTIDPWTSEVIADGVISHFEAHLGHDLVRPALERLALHPGEEQRRLGFVGIGILKSASSIRAYERHPHHKVSELHQLVHEELARDRLQRAAYAVGLVDLLFPGARPADPVSLIRAALGATAVDATPQQAVELAGEWLDRIRIADTPIDNVSAIEAAVSGSGGQRRHVEISLVTPDGEVHWHLEEVGVGLQALTLDGISAALDTIDAPHDQRPILITAPSGVMRAVDNGIDPRRNADLTGAVSRFMSRVDQRGLRVVWHSAAGSAVGR